MTRLFIEPEAEEELDEAAARYEDAVPGLGQHFLAEMRQRVGDVLPTPLSSPVFGDADDVRCAHASVQHPEDRRRVKAQPSRGSRNEPARRTGGSYERGGTAPSRSHFSPARTWIISITYEKTARNDLALVHVACARL